MANASPIRVGQVNGAGDTSALFLKQFAGEVLTAFETTNVMESRHMVKTITSGKSAQFPAVGKISSEYHTPGAELAGLAVNQNERVITIDGLLISHAFVADIDEAMNHYDARSIYSMEMGRQLAKQYDKNVLQEIVLGARAAALVTGENGGTAIIDDDMKNDGGTAGSATEAAKASAIAKNLFAAAQALDEKDAGEEGRTCILSPAEYFCLVQNTDVINRDWGGSGMYSDGKVWRVAGIDILKSNNLPHTDLSGAAFHGVDATKTVGVVFTKQAAATVKLLNLSVQKQWDIRRQGTLLVARYAVGHGYLRPDCAAELKLSTLTY